MEIYAIYNWGVSPFNDDFGTVDNYVFLQVLTDPTIESLNPATDLDKYIMCSFPFKSIQAIFPYSTIEVIAEKEGNPVKGKMVINKIILNEDMSGQIVKTKKVGGLNVFDKALEIPSTDLTQDGSSTWLNGLTGDDAGLSLATINVTISRDPISCRLFAPNPAA
jgi:hypothetical protein